MINFPQRSRRDGGTVKGSGSSHSPKGDLSKESKPFVPPDRSNLSEQEVERIMLGGADP